MSKRKHGMRMLILVFFSALLMAGCAVRANVSGYVEGALDARYKAEYTKYMRMTECSQSEAQQLHEDRLDACMASIDPLEISDELKEGYRTLFDRLLVDVHYSVKKEKKKEDHYTVEVNVEPYSMFEGVEEELDQAVDTYYTQVTEDALLGKSIPTDDQARQKVYELLLDILNDRMNQITYGKEESITIHVTKKDGHTFSIHADDLEKLDGVLIHMDSLGL